MNQIETWLDCDLQKLVKVKRISGSLFRQDAQANKIGVRVYNGGEEYSLSGTATGYIIKPDGTMVSVSGTISGNTAYIILPATAYTVAGRVFITIKNTVGSVTTTLAALETTIC